MKTPAIDKYQYDLNRNKRSQARDSLINYINNISIFDMDSVRTQLGMLVMVTSQTDEISRNSGVNLNPKFTEEIKFEIFFFSIFKDYCRESMYSIN